MRRGHPTTPNASAVAQASRVGAAGAASSPSAAAAAAAAAASSSVVPPPLLSHSSSLPAPPATSVSLPSSMQSVVSALPSRAGSNLLIFAPPQPLSLSSSPATPSSAPSSLLPSPSSSIISAVNSAEAARAAEADRRRQRFLHGTTITLGPAAAAAAAASSSASSASSRAPPASRSSPNNAAAAPSRKRHAPDSSDSTPSTPTKGSGGASAGGKGSKSSSNASTPERPIKPNAFWSADLQKRLSMHDPSQFPELPPPSSQRQVVFVCRDSDEISVDVSDSDEPAYKGIYRLLADNPVLRSSLSNPHLSVEKGFTLGEMEVLRLHTLLRLRWRQLGQPGPYDIHISFISLKSFVKHFEAMSDEDAAKRTPMQHKSQAQQWTELVFDFGAQEFEDAASPGSSSATKPATAAAAATTGRMFFRRCNTVRQLTAGAPIRALQCTPMMLERGLGCSPQEQDHAMHRIQLWMLNQQNLHHAAVCVPPLGWDEVERKHKVYETFKEHMIESRWVEVPADAFQYTYSDAQIEALISKFREDREALEEANKANASAAAASSPAASFASSPAASTPELKGNREPPVPVPEFRSPLLDHAMAECQLAQQAILATVEELLKDQQDGVYYLKASHGECGERVKRVVVKDGDSSDLVPLVTSFALQCNQSHLGLQRAVASFEKNEYRHWCIAVPGDEPQSKRWLYSFSLKTAKNDSGSGALDAQLSAPLSRESVACYDLVKNFLSEQSGPIHDYLQELLDQGVPALRIDCGYDYSTRRAFFNEFGIPTDASYWPTVHNLPLPLHIAETIGFLLFEAVDLQQSGVGTGAANSSSASTAASSSSRSAFSAATSSATSEAASQREHNGGAEADLGASQSAPESTGDESSTAMDHSTC